MRSMVGLRCVVTGANSGIGKAIATAFATQGAEVTLVCRNRSRGEDALEAIRSASGNKTTELMLCDMGDLDSVRAFASEWKKKSETHIDVFSNNAAIFVPDRQLSPQGFEMMYAVNHLGPFLLTHLLFDSLIGSRVITTSSLGHFWGHVDLDDLNYERGFWSAMRQYGTTKLCSILFTRELQKRALDKKIFTACFHPGVVATGFAQDENGWLNIGMRLGKPFFLTAEQGADTGVFLANAEDPSPYAGMYLAKRKVRKPFGQGKDDALAAKLWEITTAQVGL